MVNLQGLKSYCRECGACGMCGNTKPSSPDMASDIADAIVKALRSKVSGTSQPNTGKTIPLGVSNRHIHLRKETFERLFGQGIAFEPLKDLYIPGEWASKHTCVILGPKMNPLRDVRILGPFRNYDQIEISVTDAIHLGLNPPVRLSGDVKGSSPVTIAGPKGTVELPEGAIIAARHVHMNDKDAAEFGIKDGDRIRVRINGKRPMILEDIFVRTKENWRTQLHLDTDEANAAGTFCGTEIEFAGKMP